MERVLDRLWIGSAEDAQAPLDALGFSAALDLRDGRTHVSDGVAVFRVTNRDGDPWSREQVTNALDFVARNLAHGRVLVLCAAGMSRSASMIIGHLVRSGFSAAEAHELVRRARPRIAPVPHMLESVLRAVRP